MAKLERDYRQERAERGLDPAKLSAAQTTGFRFICHVGPGESIHTTAYETQGSFEQALEAERKKNTETAKKLDNPERVENVAQLNAEFGFDPTCDGEAKKKDDDE
jgi:hypothetical protein